MRRNWIRPVLLAVALLLLSAVSGGLLRVASASQGDSPVWQPQIAIVWPHDGGGNAVPAEQSTLVNVSVWPRNQVECDDQRASRFRLLIAVGNEPAEVLGEPDVTTYRRMEGGAFPSLEFNDILANLRDEPGARYAFVVYGEETLTHPDFAGNVWVHAADARTMLPDPELPPPCVPSPQALDPETTYLAFVGSHCEGAAPSSCSLSLFVIDPDGGEAINLTPHSPATYSFPAYSPDGRWLAFLSDRDSLYEHMAIYVERADGGGLRQISERYFQTYGPVFWSRDGRRLAIRYPGDGKYHIYTLEGDRPERVDVLPLAEWIWPNDSPDGRWRVRACGTIATQPLTGGWCLQPLEGQEENPFASLEDGMGRVAWSPDGQRIALDLSGRIHVAGRDGSGLVKLAEGHSPTWQPRP